MDGERPEVFRETHPKARTQHVCCECLGVIEPGATYENATGLWDWYWSTYKTCEPCSVLRIEFAAQGDGSFMYEELSEEVSENGAEVIGADAATVWLARLADRMAIRRAERTKREAADG